MLCYEISHAAAEPLGQVFSVRTHDDLRVRMVSQKVRGEEHVQAQRAGACGPPSLHHEAPRASHTREINRLLISAPLGSLKSQMTSDAAALANVERMLAQLQNDDPGITMIVQNEIGDMVWSIPLLPGCA
jgi:hypothetical protein